MQFNCIIYCNIYQHESKKGQIVTEKGKEQGKTKETERGNPKARRDFSNHKDPPSPLKSRKDSPTVNLSPKHTHTRGHIQQKTACIQTEKSPTFQA